MADPTADPTPDPTPAPTDPPADPPKTDDSPTDPEKGKGGKDAILADLAAERDKRQALESQVNDLRAAQQQQLDDLAKALGLKSDDDPPDPARLAQEISDEKAKTAAAETRATDAERQLAVFKVAHEHEGNPLALLDSSSFLRSIAEIDPNDSTKIGEAVKVAVEGNPLFKSTPATAALFPGGARPPAPQPRATSLEEAVNARMASQQNR